MLSRIRKDFREYYTSLESLLNEACILANKETNADILQSIVDLHELAKFIEVDFEQFNDILSDIDNYVAKHNVEGDRLD